MKHLNRRRFLAISAASILAPATAKGGGSETTWTGRAMGADVSIALSGTERDVHEALASAQDLLRRVEAAFNLYDPKSEISQLNQTGHLKHPSDDLRAVLKTSRRLYIQTKGLFDPTVQSLWRAHALGDPPDPRSVGLNRVTWNEAEVRMEPGQSVTFNGIAQGYATDLVTADLRARGFTRALINLGEYSAIGGPWTLGLVDPEHGYLGHRTLRDHAVATSSPDAFDLGRARHILHPSARPHWSTVSVAANSAMLADGLSTALCLADSDQVNAISDRLSQKITKIALVNKDGDIISRPRNS